MRCILLNSPLYWEHSDADEEYLPPIGLGYIATYMALSEIDVRLVDCVKERLGVNEILDLLTKDSFDCLGINIFTQNYDIVKHIVENCPPNKEIFIGGQVVKSIYQDIIGWNVHNTLTIVIGEGELILPSILLGKCLEEPIYRVNNKVTYRVDKESRYFPLDLSTIKLDRRYLKNDVILNHYSQLEAAIITSRGCMYNCAFCGGAHYLNNDITIRRRSSESVEIEISGILKDHPYVTSIRVLDDLFLRNRETMIEATNLFEKFNGLSWRGMVHIQSFIHSLDLLPLLRSTGCKELFIGIESGSEKVRKKINKVGSVSDIIYVIKQILSTGIDVKGYFIYGFPDETLDDFEATYSLASDLKSIAVNTPGKFRSSVFQFRPYHGTKIYDEIIQSGREIHAVFSNPNLADRKGRSQFDFESGNYSTVSQVVLDEYIKKT